MAEPDRDLAEPASSAFNTPTQSQHNVNGLSQSQSVFYRTSTQSQNSNGFGQSQTMPRNDSAPIHVTPDTFHRYTEGVHFNNFTCNTNLPLYEWLDESKRKHDQIRQHAVDVMNLEEERRRLEHETTVIDKLKAAAILAHKAKKQKVRKERYEKKLEEQRLAGIKDLADAEVEIAKVQQARAESPPAKPYKRKKIEQAQIDEITAALATMDGPQRRQVNALVLKERPLTLVDEDFGTEIDLKVLSMETLSRIHDLVERYFPDLVSAPPAIEAPPATQAPVIQPASPAARSASPPRKSPRNHRGLGLNPPDARAPSSANPAHMQAHASVALTSAGAPAVPTNHSTALANHAAQLMVVHHNLKEFRVFIEDLKKKDPPFKKAAGHIRRTIQGRMNVISKDKQGNANARNTIIDVIRASLRPNCGMDGPVFRIPPTDPTPFLLAPRNELFPKPAIGLNEKHLPVTFIYAIHMLAKMAVKKFIEECSSDPRKADNVGLLVTVILAMPEFQWRGGSMIDILTAKFRHDIPVLFGIRGSEKTQEGRARLGWRRNGSEWIDVHTHNQRMTGLAAGFSSIALRDFSKSTKMVNPYKPDHWWSAVAAIIETPVGETSDTQFTVLKYMIEGWEDKIFCMWGDKGMLQIYNSIKLFPEQQETKTAAVLAINAMWDTLAKKWGFGAIGSCPPPLGLGFGVELRSPLSPVWGGPPPFSPMHGVNLPPSSYSGGHSTLPFGRIAKYSQPQYSPATPNNVQMHFGNTPVTAHGFQHAQQFAAFMAHTKGCRSNGNAGLGSAAGVGAPPAANANFHSNFQTFGGPPRPQQAGAGAGAGIPGHGNYQHTGNFQTYGGQPQVQKPTIRFLPNGGKRARGLEDRDPAGNPDA